MSQVETKFSKIAGLITQMETYQNKLYGLTSSGAVWEWYLSRWKKLSGNLSSITVGAGGVWGLDSNNTVFLLNEEKSTFVSEESLKLKYISSNSQVLGIGLDSYPYKWNGKSFDLISSDLKAKSLTGTKSGKVYCLSLDSVPHEYENSKWKMIEGKKFKTLLSDEDVLCGIALDNSIWQYKDTKWISEMNGKEISTEKKAMTEVKLEKKESSSSMNPNITSPKVTTHTKPTNSQKVTSKIEMKSENFKVEQESTMESPKTKKTSKGFSLVIQKEKCLSCSKTVYANEKITADGKIYHQRCFRCKHCNCKLTFSNFSQLDNVPYCKTHLLELFKRNGKYDFGDKESKSQELANLDSPSTESKEKIENSDVVPPSSDIKVEKEPPVVEPKTENKTPPIEKVESKQDKPLEIGETKQNKPQAKVEAKLETKVIEQQVKAEEKDVEPEIVEEKLEVETETTIAEEKTNGVEKLEEQANGVEKEEEQTNGVEKITDKVESKSEIKKPRMRVLESLAQEEDDEEEEDDDELLIEDVEDHQFTDDLKLYEMFQNQIISDHEEEEEEQVIIKPKKQKKEQKKDENVVIHILKSEEVEVEGKDGIEKGLAAEIEFDEDEQYPSVPYGHEETILSKEDEKRMEKYRTYLERGIMDDEEYIDKQNEIYSKYERKEKKPMEEEELEEENQEEEEEEEEQMEIPPIPEEYQGITLSSEDEEKLKKYQTYFQKEILDDEEYMEKVSEIYSKYK